MKLRHYTKRTKKLFLILSVLIVGGVTAAATLWTQPTTAAPGPITGSVFNDVNANGVKDTGEGAFPNLAIVNLYSSNGTYIRSRTSDSSGNFSISGLSAGTYYISVYNTGRTAAVTTTPGLINTIGTHVEPTYAGVGSGAGAGSGPICVGAAPTYTQRANYTSSPSEWTAGAPNGTSTGPCFGGRNATITNPSPSTVLPLTYSANSDYTGLNSALNTQKMVSRVVLTEDGGVNNVDFGLSAHAVTHTNNSGQGSFSQFIANANINSGAHPMRFTPAVPANQTSGASTWWRISPSSAIETISSASTTIDGRAYSNVNGSTQLDTNSGVLTGPNVGTDNYKIPDFQKPELEIVGDPRAGGTTALFRVTGSDTTIRHLALNSSANYPSSDSKFVQQSAGSNMTVEHNLMGVHPVTGANSANRPQFAIQTAYLLSLNATGAYRHNFISANDQRGMLLAGGLLGGGNVVSLLLGDWIIEQNDGPSAGVAFGSGTTRIQVRYNNMPTAALDAAALNFSLGLHVLTENTISGGGGVQLHASPENTITKNIITNATGSNPGVLVDNLSIGNFISQNHFGGNGGNAIDLNGDGPSENELLGCVTLSPEIIGLANLGIARPNVQNARLSGNQLTLNINYCGVGIYDVELYKATAGSGDSNAGEGVTYLGRFLDLALINGTITNQTITVSGLSPGDSLSAIVINPITGNTSEFGPNTTVLSPPTAPTTAPDMTAETDTGASNTDNLTYINQPTFVGTCTNGQEVTLYLDGAALSPTQICSGGNYSITPSAPIPDGAYLLWSTFKNEYGESTPSPVLAITIDTTPPNALAAPDMTAETDTGVSNTDNITSNPQPVFTGSCTITESVNLYIDGNLVASALCVDGTYALSPSSAVANGSHTATVVAVDHAGNVSAPSSGLAFTIDTSAPAAPVITAPTSGSATNDTTPTFSGTGENGATVTVRDGNGNTLCTAVVSGGQWSCTPSTGLAEGQHTITATQTDPAGNTSPASTAITLTIDTTAPDAPVITAPADGTATNDNTPTVSGTATANSTVLLSIDGQSPVTVQADGSGNWTYTTPTLADGSHTFVAIERDAAGNESEPSSTITITVDTTAPTVTVNQKDGQADPATNALLHYTIVFSEPINGTTFAPSDFTITTDPETEDAYVDQLTQINSTTWEAVVTGMPNNTTVSLSLGANTVQDPAGNNNQASTSTDNSITYEVGAPSVTPLITNDNTPTLTGECITTHSLQVDLDGPSSHTYTLACDDGEWSLQIPDTLADGSYDVIVTDTTVGGLTNAPENQTDALRVDTVRPTVTVNKKDGQADPTNVDEAYFTVVFSEPINPSTFVAGDLDVSGTSGTAQITQINETTWEVHISDLAHGDTVSVSLPADRVQDIAGNNNFASTSTDNSVSYDGEAPEAPVLTAPADNSLTANATVTVTGTGENGATVTVIVDGAGATCNDQPIVVADGTWSCTLSAALADGSHTITARQTDAAGNESDNAPTRTITVDTTAPAQPDAPTLAPSSDTGESDSDGITSDTTPTFTGTCVDGDTITLYSGSTQIGQTICEDGTYEITSDPLADGEHDITVTATDPAGNVSVVSDPTTVVIDSAAPSAPGITAPADEALLTDNTPTISGTGEDDAVVELTANGTPVICSEGTVRVVSGSWSCTPASPLSDGEYDLVAIQTDPAGNESPASATTTITIDTTAPATPSQPDLAAGSDTGDSNTDNLTNDTTPTFSGTCEDGSTVILYSGSTQIGSAACSDGEYEITVDPALGEGTHIIHAVATDEAGNESAPSSTLTITIDTTAPAIPDAPDLAAGSDTGASDTDNVTSDNTPTFSGSCTEGDTIKLYVDGSLAGQAFCNSSDQYNVTPVASLGDGTYDVTVTSTDPAGNASAASSALSVTIDTTAPTTPTVLSPADGTITNDTTPTFSGTAEPNSVLTVTVNGTPVSCTEGQQVQGDGSWSCTPTAPLAEGSYDLEVAATDLAGNTSSPNDSVSFTIDTTAPAQPGAPDLDSGSDTGPSNTDNITSVTTPAFTGSCVSGDIIRLYADGTLVGEATCAGSTYSVQPDDPLADGAYGITATATDPAGNVSVPSPALSVTIDSSTPDAPVITAPTDGTVTTDSTPTISGTGEDGATIELTANGTLLTCAEGIVQVTSGSWSCTPASPLSDDEYELVATQTDLAGNESDPSDAITIIVDTTPPATPSQPDLTAASDTGASNTDNITSDTTPTFTGTCENGSTVTLYSGSTPIGSAACTGGAYEITADPALADGSYAIHAVAQDAAGNTSGDSSTLTVVIDTAAPNTLDAPDLVASSDSGASDTDDVTNDNTPTFTGTCDQNDTVQLYVNAVLAGQATCDDDEYTITSSSLDDGTYPVTVTATNLAGNQSAVSSALTVTIDTVEPDMPTVTSPEHLEIVSTATPTISGDAEPHTTLTAGTNGDTHTCTEGHGIDHTGQWDCTPTAPLDEDDHELVVFVTDLAGNDSEEHSFTTFTVDITAPDALDAPDLASASDSGVSNTDNLTNVTTPTFTGTCIDGDTVQLYADGALVGQTTCTDGSYAVQPTDPLDEGEHDITVTATDPGGNVSAPSDPLTITIDTSVDTPTVAPDLTPTSDTGPSNTDDVTNDTTPTFTGTCTDGESVTLYSGSTVIAQAACSGGSFTATASPALGEGQHQISFTVTDPAGNVSGNSPILTITIDITAPGAPVITTPPNNTATNNRHPAIAGTGTNGNYIQVFDNGSPVTCAEGTITVQSDTWSCTPLSALSTGSHTFTATQADLAGNVSGNSNAVTLLIDITPPARPARPDLTDSSDSGVSNTDNITNITTPTIAGTCETGDTITLRLAGVAIAQQVCASNAYLITVPTPLTDGSKAFTVVATDPAGNSSSPSLTLTVIIDTVAEKPATPDLDADSDSGYSNTDNITHVSFPTITGTCQAGETVRVFFDNVLHKVTPCFPPFLAQPLDNLTQGNHSVTIEVIDIAGNLSPRSDALIITIDNIAPVNPTILVPAAGTTPTVNSSSYTTSGTTEANAFITVWRGSTLVCSTTSNGSGAWSCNITGLTNGSHTFNYMATDRAGNPSPNTSNRTINVSL